MPSPSESLRRLVALFLLLWLPFSLQAAPPAPLRIGFFVGDTDVAPLLAAVKGLAAPDLEVRIFTDAHTGHPDMQAFVRRMDVAVVDIMSREPAGWLLGARRTFKPGAEIYAVRSGAQVETYTRAGWKMDREVRAYVSHPSRENLQALLAFLRHRHRGLGDPPPAAVVPPPNALYHPDAPGPFARLEDYVAWYRASGRLKPGAPWNLVIIVPTFQLEGRNAPLHAVLQRFEAAGVNTVTWFREMKDRDETLERLLKTEPLASGLASITGFDFKFSTMAGGRLQQVLQGADVPVLNAQSLFFTTRRDWLARPEGFSLGEIPFQFSTPELSGLIEPTLVGAKEKEATDIPGLETFRHVAVEDRIDTFVRRALAWHRLRAKANRDKEVVVMYYNHGASKENVGASYLNVFRSLSRILETLKGDGYDVQGDTSEAAVKARILAHGLNLPGVPVEALPRLAAEGDPGRLSMECYRAWYALTPAAFRQGVERDWGAPEAATLQVHRGTFLFPRVRFGKVTLVPQPVRGWGEDPEKLYHSTVLYPHHMYNAFYAWLQTVVKPDALVSLGTHGTHEWLPGKQAGLTSECPPEVLIGDIPVLYPYVVDDVGEALQAKRRGKAVILTHATPPLRLSGLAPDLLTLAGLLSEWKAAPSEVIRVERARRIEALGRKTGLWKELELTTLDEAAAEQLQAELEQQKLQMAPHGLHTYGESGAEAWLAETAAAMARGEAPGEAPGAHRPAARHLAQLLACGPKELEGLLRGLRGGFIPPGPGNDPLRNPDSLPTGRNVFGFDPDKVPSREAWSRGQKAASELIEAHRQKHGKPPRQVGVILWSVETLRDEGINSATALALMGVRPVFDSRDKIRDLDVIPAAELGRPRVDVLLQMSGLFRDSFPQVAQLLDRAVKLAARQPEPDNAIRLHAERIEQKLTKAGKPPEEAKRWSLARLFSAPPGAYGTKVDDFAKASGHWDQDSVVVEQGFIAMQSHAYGEGFQGEPMKELYKELLKEVDATVHTLSSNLYGTLDNDDMFQYLGGLSMAVRSVSGRDPGVYVNVQRAQGRTGITPAAAVLGQEMRARYLNPQWMEGMKGEGYAGARDMAEFTENLWGWQLATPGQVDKAHWEGIYDTYVKDSQGLGIQTFMAQANPWAHQSMTGRMLEAVRKGYWQADAATREGLAVAYAQNVATHGVSGQAHTTDNPVLNQMVQRLLARHPELQTRFTEAMERAAGRSLGDQVLDRQGLLARLAASLRQGSAAPGTPGESASRSGGSRRGASGPAESTGDAFSAGGHPFLLLPIKLFRGRPIPLDPWSLLLFGAIGLLGWSLLRYVDRRWLTFEVESCLKGTAEEVCE